jgi:multidrug efflux pump subunit AcrA (membrane-fusion protein)
MPAPRHARLRSSTVLAGIAAEIASWGLSLATVAGLAAVGWFGHATHWTFRVGDHAAHGSPAHSSDTAATHPRSQAGGAAVIRFDSPEAVERSGIELVPVESRPMVDELVVNGVVRYDERHVAQLSTRVAGSVWRVDKHLGDRVARGDVLLVVESSDVGRLKAEFLNSLVAFEARREQLAILEEVKGAVMGRQLREATSALREARNHLVIAEQALVNLGFQITVADFLSLDDESRAARIRTLGLTPELLAGADPEHVTSNLIPLRAPFDGIVIGREAVVGEIVEAGRQIFEVADVSTMWVVLSVSKEDASSVSLGQTVRFRPDGADEDCVSRISWISTEVDSETRTLEVRMEIPADPAAPLRANTYGSGRIEVARMGAAVVVPSASVQWDGSRWVVFVPAGEAAFEPRPVQPGLRNGDLVEISGDFAVSPPSHVVGMGSHVLKSKILLERMESGEL